MDFRQGPASAEREMHKAIRNSITANLMTVELISHTAAPESLVASAARLCYSDCGTAEIRDGFADREKAAAFVDMLLSMGHESPLEHITFTFTASGVSRALLAQLTRHRMASYSVQSQRYVKLSDFPVVTPPSVAENPEATALFAQAMEEAKQAYAKLSALVPAEDARFVLPNACGTQLIFTMNARSLLNFFRHRCCNRAQWEIRELAERMLELVTPAAPSVFRCAGAGCVTGKCPEGVKTCGFPKARIKREEKNQ